jgi:hypothetical protein
LQPAMPGSRVIVPRLHASRLRQERSCFHLETSKHNLGHGFGLLHGL